MSNGWREAGSTCLNSEPERRRGGRGSARRPPRRLACLVALASVTIALAGCSTSGPPPIAHSELAAARAFPYYTVYWVGMKFGSDPLTAADGVEGYKPQIGDSLYYGNCVSNESVLSTHGCLLPLQVTTVIYVLHSNLTLGPQRNIVIRGVPAVIYDKGRSIELYSGRVAIDIFSNDLKNAMAGAQQLRPFNSDGSDSTPLPLPVYCPVLYGPETEAVKQVMANLPEHACKRAKEALSRRESLKEEGS